MSTESRTLDTLDRRILHTLQVAPRAPFARIATVLEVSEQTVARRFQRMRTGGIVRIVARPEATHRAGATYWTLRIGCRPGTAAVLAKALAQRGDTSWVSIGAGGAEVTCQAEVDDPQSGLLHHLPRASSVLAFSAHQMLHRFAGRGEIDWVAPDHDLSVESREFLADGAPPRQSPNPTGGARLEAADRPLLDALSRDGRASWATVATVTGISQRQAAHRVSELAAAGAIYFHVDVATTAVGMHAVANLWFTVAPAHLASTGDRLADHPELAFVGAVTGSANLMASALATDAEALYLYLTTKVAEIDSIQRVEIVPQMVRLKHSHSLVESGLIREPPT
ncbi:DNA-binding Lrp family transcriptional regulator [Actinoplanes tereljensis]|uniref:AsnC family transcriptional regulator n=1 Tax=Paractinoplanes tereljensis TaxID=571912 RepID=A0A919NGC0_9ACTN|nr:AsnC family transcriptional regulator [Actinoplanes tereljensis]GIF17462.1 AsnC family transcriptional regulator [Actinoplanes tereljensis]